MFLSYEWGNQDQVKQLCRNLTEIGFECWMDVERLFGGDRLYERLLEGIQSCDVFIACITSNYPHRKNTKQEVANANACNKPIIPLLFSGKWTLNRSMFKTIVERLHICVEDGFTEQKMKEIKNAIEGKHVY